MVSRYVEDYSSSGDSAAVSFGYFRTKSGKPPHIEARDEAEEKKADENTPKEK